MRQNIHRPHSALFWMTIFLALIGALAVFLFVPLRTAVMANGAFNAVILSVLLIGVLVHYRQVLALYRESAWIEAFRRSDPEKPIPIKPHLLAPMARMLSQRERGTLSLSAMSTRSLLDSIRSRLDESRDLSRYMVGLLVFLGLLGTFWGLLATIGDVRQVISGLGVDHAEATAVFERLKAGLEGPLSGMGIAFSSSLFGLAGSLILGFLDLQAGHAQNRFFNTLEEWLSSLTRLSTGALPGDGEGNVPAYVQALLEQTADSLERLQRGMSEQSEIRGQMDRQLSRLNQNLGDLVQQQTTQSQGMSDDLRSELRLLNRTLAAALKGREDV